MKTRSTPTCGTFQTLPSEYGSLCRNVGLPRPIRDQTDSQTALAAIAPLWGFEKEMSADQSNWFELVADLIADYESRTEPQPKRLPLAKCLAGLLEVHSMTAADFACFLKLEPSMGSKLLNGRRHLPGPRLCPVLLTGSTAARPLLPTC